jgi:hypothetical protein
MTRSLSEYSVRREASGKWEQFFDRLRRMVVLFDEKNREHGPIARRRTRTLMPQTGS